MPRIYTGSNEPLDFCSRHFPSTEGIARQRYGEGEGPDGRGNCFEYDASHPPYDMSYQCLICKRALDEFSDGYAPATST